MCLVKPYQSIDNNNFASEKDTNFVFPWVIANSLTNYHHCKFSAASLSVLDCIMNAITLYRGCGVRMLSLASCTCSTVYPYLLLSNI